MGKDKSLPISTKRIDSDFRFHSAQDFKIAPSPLITSAITFAQLKALLTFFGAGVIWSANLAASQ